MNDFQRAKQNIEVIKCPTCKGLGKCDDASPYDMIANYWICPTCKGTGVNPIVAPHW